MNLRFKNKNLCRAAVLFIFCIAPGLFLLLASEETVWHVYNYKALDHYYKWAVARQRGPQASFSPQIVYLTITDETYDHFGKNILDRNLLARANDALSRLTPQAVAYDIIFARPGSPASDATFTRSLRDLKPVYLPVGCALSRNRIPFRWEAGRAYERLREDHLGKPLEKGNSQPLHATRAILQHDEFADAASGSGDISASADPDSVYRHLPMLVRVDEHYLPTLSLAVFLDWAGVPLEDVLVEWGRRLRIPAAKSGRIREDVIIPIDRQGRAYVPFMAHMGEDFPEIAMHTFLEASEDETLRGNLLEIFEGNFVFVADVASGISDLGATPLQDAVPLVTLHVAFLNALLTNTFYAGWSFRAVIGTVILLCLLLGMTAMFRSSWPLYLTGPIVAAALLILTWTEFTHFRLLPIASICPAVLTVFFGLVIIREIMSSKERFFIRSTFARYMPESVVRELLANPDALRLGGEEREATVLFSDIEGFTSISECMAPTALVTLLNEYLTEMTAIIREQGGIIDKFQGDAIMAEFGVPLPVPDHADQAVMAGLNMQKRLRTLRANWTAQGLPALRCRVGINTGKMVVGNMGSDEVLDYTVIGDAVNLASRLEGANKRYGTFLMISEFTFEALTPGRFRTRDLDVIRVKGKKAAVRVCEVLGERSGPDADPYYAIYEEAFNAYLSRDFTRARAGFEKALSFKPDDPASLDMLQRIRDIIPENLPPDWDGSIRMRTKKG